MMLGKRESKAQASKYRKAAAVLLFVQHIIRSPVTSDMCRALLGALGMLTSLGLSRDLREIQPSVSCSTCRNEAVR